MPITFTSGLTPTFPANSFGSEKEHVKRLGTELVGFTAFVNPLATVLTALVTQIDATNALLDTDIAVANSEATTLQGYIDGTLPNGWATATPTPFTDSDMASVKSGIEAYVTRATASKANNNVFKNFLTQVDVDNFRLHNDLLCGLRAAPPSGIIKPNLNGLMGLTRAITDIENTFGVVFTNYLVPLFNTLFTGDTTVAAAKAHMDTTPLSTTYDSLNIVSLVNVDPFISTPAAIEQLISGITFSIYDTAVDGHQANFQTHITNDMAQYDAVVAKLSSYVQAYQISGHIQDPYYAFMYTDVFGSATVNDIITLLQNGDIT
jgi:hypothetical protein